MYKLKPKCKNSNIIRVLYLLKIRIKVILSLSNSMRAILPGITDVIFQDYYSTLVIFRMYRQLLKIHPSAFAERIMYLISYGNRLRICINVKKEEHFSSFFYFNPGAVKDTWTFVNEFLF